MEIVVASTYEELSKKLANDLISFIGSIKEPLICTASGDSPSGLYKELVERAGHKELDLSDCWFVGLDEWVGMNEGDEGSCRFHLNNQFFHPLNIKKENICFFNGKSQDLKEECEMTEDFITQHGGIDVAIVGLGLNGHVGMNEPGTSPLLRSHLTQIALQTQKVGQKYFSNERDLSYGLTLGIANLMEAKRIMLIVSGSHKAPIVQKVIEGEISEKVPASLLKNHPGLTIYLDQTAAQLISSNHD